ncbi:DASH complex, subunit Spc19 [Aureobasidium pullulans EXF-150]|uniref:DASH complex subunit SPC19 n=1 Tax=Aureobasidium pullulans EXF-150 TaxID=1043002 RepID=A0A074YR42_AURPU|nr:DASH complex, subunit Spc19 [Aureobasidium pullulans EXF-150]KEQ89346.1 DASH complex, subunit Spc19 [Aureobasidium pullulans EXF-150]
MSAANTLENCVSSLRSSMQLLDSSINILDSGTSDFPRLAKVLQATRHFELVSEPELQNAQSSLLSEIQPEVESMLDRVAVYLDKLQRREESLIAKCELQQGRLSSRHPEQQYHSKGSAQSSSHAGVTPLEELKMQQLRQKKDRLSYAVGRLELQANQRERQLRKSMAGF